MKVKFVKSIKTFNSVIQTNYDIVKSHGGEFKVKTREGLGAKFIIQLPLEKTIYK